MEKFKHIVIIGGGFGGVATAKALAKLENCKITLIDRRNYYLFQPLLYQVAMAGLNPSDISVPLRKIFSKQKNMTVLMAEVDSLDLNKNQIGFDGKTLEFNYLILSCGAKHFYFGNDSWEEQAPGLKTIEQATEIRRRVLLAFENAEKESDFQKRQSYLTFAVVGAGPTGVELAGAISEMARMTLFKDFRRADLKKTRVLLIEGASRVLPGFSERSSQMALKSLRDSGVEVFLNSKAAELTSEGITVNGEKIEAKTILWAAGVKPSKISEQIPGDKDSSGRARVENDLSLKNFPHVFVIGDQASFLDLNGKSLPGVAPVAIQQGKHVAQQIISDQRQKPRKSFRYLDKGMMATIGRAKAVVSFGKLEFSGIFAWLVWVLIHILYLMQFKNRIFVFFQWVWAYFSFGTGARLIVHKAWKFYSGEKVDLRP